MNLLRSYHRFHRPSVSSFGRINEEMKDQAQMKMHVPNFRRKKELTLIEETDN